LCPGRTAGGSAADGASAAANDDDGDDDDGDAGFEADLLFIRTLMDTTIDAHTSECNHDA
jgi:hypothetical protein